MLLIFIAPPMVAQGFNPADAAAATGVNKAFYQVIREQPIQKEGIFYIDKNFYITELQAYTLGKMRDVPARFDLFTNQFEIALQSSRYALRGDYIKSFSWYNTALLTKKYFLNVREFKSQKPLKGFFEVIYEGKASLLFHEQIAYYSGTQSPSVNNNAGSESMTKVSAFYLAKDSEVRKINKSKKRNQKLFGELQQQMNDYIKKHKLNYKQRGHLAMIVRHYNDLL